MRETQRLFPFGSDRYSRRNRETGLTPFRLEADRQGKEAPIDVVSIARKRPPQEVAERLNTPVDEESVVHRENHYFADDEPVQIVSTYLRNPSTRSATWLPTPDPASLRPRRLRKRSQAAIRRLVGVGRGQPRNSRRLTAPMKSCQPSRVNRSMGLL
ncbi:UTRA domain-containing protein [Streptomyces aurantiacus]|uniref:UTRA domain-containing protein n=1 Tax=Streptomyces aurantiacus TaxID=47760 RepID=UPI000AD13765|nr:UTRA domain-containing protein [Streptomyces aurantiacus]